MGLVVQHNLPALNAQNQLRVNLSNNQKATEKLSSGYRINRAGDDAAGLAISEKMRGQIRGLDQAVRNAQDGISLIQTAEGALQETHSILQRMRELAVQSANGTYQNEVDRENINKEVEALKSEIDRIATSTHFNGKRLLDGSMSADYVPEAGEGGAATPATPASATVDTLTGDTDDIAAVVGFKITFDTDADQATIDALAAELNGKTISVDDAGEITVAGLSTAFVVNGNNIEDGETNVIASLSITGVNPTNGAVSGTITAAASVAGEDGDSDVPAASENELVLQIGANGDADQRVSLEVKDQSSAGLGVDEVNVSTRTSANTSIATIDNAINSVSSTRADLGALQNRLEHTINNLSTSSENLTAAESRIRDTDMAKEMMNFTKSNILQQAAQAMLAQANAQPQAVLQLLG